MKLKLFVLILITFCCILPISVNGATIVSLNFSSSIPGTIQDTNGSGTGFTTRLPGTGSSLGNNDPNLNLLSHPGLLTITSTQSNPNTRNPPLNFDMMEAPGVKLSGIGSSDITVQALFRNVVAYEESDQLLLYIANSRSQLIRAGMHAGDFRIIKNSGGSDYQPMQIQGEFTSGDDIRLTFSRIDDSHYTLKYEDLTTGKNGLISDTYTGLTSGSDIYVGVYYANNAGKSINNPKTSQIDEFIVSVPSQNPSTQSLETPSSSSVQPTVSIKPSGPTDSTIPIHQTTILTNNPADLTTGNVFSSPFMFIGAIIVVAILLFITDKVLSKKEK